MTYIYIVATAKPCPLFSWLQFLIEEKKTTGVSHSFFGRVTESCAQGAQRDVRNFVLIAFS